MCREQVSCAAGPLLGIRENLAPPHNGFFYRLPHSGICAPTSGPRAPNTQRPRSTPLAMRAATLIGRESERQQSTRDSTEGILPTHQNQYCISSNTVSPPGGAGTALANTVSAAQSKKSGSLFRAFHWPPQRHGAPNTAFLTNNGIPPKKNEKSRYGVGPGRCAAPLRLGRFVVVSGMIPTHHDEARKGYGCRRPRRYAAPIRDTRPL